MGAVAKLGWSMFVSLTCCAGANGERPHHYVFFNLTERESQTLRSSEQGRLKERN
jgi:hypothetical protein